MFVCLSQPACAHLCLSGPMPTCPCPSIHLSLTVPVYCLSLSMYVCLSQPAWIHVSLSLPGSVPVCPSQSGCTPLPVSVCLHPSAPARLRLSVCVCVQCSLTVMGRTFLPSQHSCQDPGTLSKVGIRLSQLGDKRETVVETNEGAKTALWG